MNNTMEYKDYIGSVEFSETDGIFFGQVQGIRSLISYEGTTVKELVEDFHCAGDDYLKLYTENNTLTDSLTGILKENFSIENAKYTALDEKYKKPI